MHQAFGEPTNFASQKSCDINLPMKIIANIAQGQQINSNDIFVGTRLV
jgi:hypothetical protein